MKIKLLDYRNREHWVDIPDDTEEIEIQVISGDMVLNSPFVYDTCPCGRIMSFYDGECTIKRDKFEELNKLNDVYDLWGLTSI